MSVYSEQLEWIEEQQASGPELSYEETAAGESEVNTSLTERIGSIIGGAALVGGGIYMAVRRRRLSSALMGLGGGMLIRRGASGHCNVYEALGVNRSDATTRIGRSLSRGIDVEECVTINRPSSELYAFWRDFKNLPRIMRHLERVDVVDDKRTRWTAEGPAGQLLQWEATITQDRPNELIAWKTTERSDVPSQGSVRFRPASGDRGTVVEVMLKYRPPGGMLGAGIAKLFRREPAQEIREDLARFKAEMETGEVPTIEGQPRGTCGTGGRTG